jgi:hypothetical protein
MGWIGFEIELHGDPEGVDKPLVRAWWDGTGFVGHCTNCGGWVRFTTLGMSAVDDEAAGRLAQLPTNWAEFAQSA